MATERLLIQIDEKGARVVDARMNKLGNTTQKTTNHMRTLKRVLAGVVSVVAIRNTIRLADAYTVIQNRLGFVVKEAGQLANVTERLFDISAKTRTSFESTAEVYTRVQLAAQDLGKSQVEVLNFSESLNQALILSGAGAQEARNGMIQLSQSLASGALRGDELRAVLEQIPVVADVIAKGMGVLRGDLRRMGAEGEISSTIILESFKKARQELADKFAKTVPTVSQALEVARSQMILWVAEIDRSLGITRTLSKWLITLSSNFDALSAAILGTASALAILNFSAIVASIKSAATATTLFVGAINPLTVIAAVVVGLGTAMFYMSDKIKVASDSATTLSDVFAAISNKFQPFIQDLRAMGEITGLVFDSMFQDVDFSLKGMVLGAANKIDQMINFFFTWGAIIGEFVTAATQEFVALSVVIGNILNPFDQVDLGSLNLTGFRGIGGRIMDQIQFGMQGSRIQDSISGLFDEADAIAEQRIKIQEEAAKKNKLSEAEGINKVAIAEAKRALDDLMESTFSGAKAQEEYVEGQVILANAFGAGVITADEFVNSMTALQLKTQDAREPFEKMNRELAFQSALLGKTSQEIEIANSLRELSVDLLEHEIVVQGALKEELQGKLELMQHINEVQSMQASILEDVNGPMEEFRLAQEAINGLLDQQKISAEEAGVALQEYQLAALENSTALADQIEAINVRTLKSIGTQAQAVAKGIEGVYGSLSRVTSEFLKTGKVDFKAWGREIIGIIIKVITKLLIMKAIEASTGLGAASGVAAGVFSGVGQGVIGATNGGANAAGGRFLVGGGSGGVDQTQVAFRATAGERVTVERPDARGKFGSDGGGAVVVPAPQVTVVNVTDPNEVFSAIDSDEGEQRIMNVISRNPGVIQGIAGGSGSVGTT